MPTVDQFLAACLGQRGDRYVLGAEASPADPDPDVFDCSELVEWAAARIRVRPTVPDGSWIQAQHCYQHRTLIPVAVGLRTRGALLFRTPEVRPGVYRPGHVAVSLGDGTTIEARGRAWGVGVFPSTGRTWTHAGTIPGLDYRKDPDVTLSDADVARIATATALRVSAELHDDLAQLDHKLDLLARGGDKPSDRYQGHELPAGGLLAVGRAVLEDRGR